MKNYGIIFVLSLLLSACGGGGDSGGGASSYTVGGNVSGLSGTVVLANNGGDDLTVTANGNFTFATEVAGGSTYNVQIKTQPVGQTCSAGNNTGTVTGANVTGVVITCSTNTYSVGGTASGLSGTVILTNNGGDDLTVSADGSFIFATEVADGGAYNVQVKTQPTGQTCSAGNNTGTILGAAITSVAVTCSTNTYSVGGNVSGLSGTMILTNNGGNDLTVTANDSFSFTTEVADSAGFAVTIKSAPLTQNCVVSNGAGTISGANVTNVTVACVNKSWTHPASLSDNISPDGSGTVGYSRVAMDNNGNAVVIWNQRDGSNYEQIFKSEYRNSAWVYPANVNDYISRDTTSEINSYAVAMDDNGSAIIAWHHTDGVNDQIFKSEYRNGVWTHPASQSDNISPDGQNAFDPQVAMDNNGNAIIVWKQYNSNGNWEIFKSEYRNGAWSHPSGLNDYISIGGNDATAPQVAMDDNGNAVIAWMQHNGTYWQIFKSEYRNGAWTHPSSLSDNISPAGVDARSPQVAMDDNGNAIIVWYQNDGSNYQIFKSEYRSGAWAHPTSLSDNISPDGGDAYSPQVAIDNNGNAIVVWQRFGEGTDQIFKSEYRNGSWTHPADLDDNISLNTARAPQVAMDDSGNVIIVWYQHDGANYQIFKSEYRSGAWSQPSGLSDNISPDGSDASSPHVAMDNKGNAVIVWQQSDGANYQIFKSEYR